MENKEEFDTPEYEGRVDAIGSSYKKLIRSEATEKIYARRTRNILRNYLNDTGMEWKDDPTAFTEWLLAKKNSGAWKKGTWRMTRIAIQEYLHKENAPIECIDKITHEGNLSFRVKGSFKSERVRRLPEDDLSKILDLLENPFSHGLKGSDYDKMLAHFLKNNILIGLRPSEWDSAKLIEIEGEKVILVRNRKTNNGRSNGEERLLHIKKSSIKGFEEAFAERDRLYFMGFDWAEIQSNMAIRLRNIRDLVTSESYTLYSTRHRFVTAAKQTGLSKKDIADMLGHKSEKTAGLHYGKKFSRIKTGGENASENQEEIIVVTKGEGIRRSEHKKQNEKMDIVELKNDKD